MLCEKRIDSISTDFPYNDENHPCPVDYCLELLDGVRGQMCGFGVFCRDAVNQLRKILYDITTGQATSSDLALVEEICSATEKLADCDLTKDIAGEVLRILTEYRDVFESHIGRKRCAALACYMLTFVYIDPVKCVGCGDCISVCPEAAIEGGDGLIHVIDSELCTGCSECIKVCQHNAIVRMDAAGVKPRLPESPVPVGSIKASPASGKKGLRRGLRPK